MHPKVLLSMPWGFLISKMWRHPWIIVQRNQMRPDLWVLNAPASDQRSYGRRSCPDAVLVRESKKRLLCPVRATYEAGFVVQRSSFSAEPIVYGFLKKRMA